MGFLAGNSWSKGRTCSLWALQPGCLMLSFLEVTVIQCCNTMAETGISHRGLKKSICVLGGTESSPGQEDFYQDSLIGLKENTDSSQLQGWREKSESFFHYLCNPAWILNCVLPFSREGAGRKLECFEGICQYWKGGCMWNWVTRYDHEEELRDLRSPLSPLRSPSTGPCLPDQFWPVTSWLVTL